MARPQVNNNPFALIQPNPSAWQGLKGKNPDGFLIFNDAYSGIRAGFINLINTYINKGLNTIEKIFPVYAPAGHGDNVPEDYIKRAVQLTGIPRNQPITKPEDIYKLGKAIVTHEEGKFWVSQADFDKGFKAAMEAKKISIPTTLIAGSSIVLILIIALIIFL